MSRRPLKSWRARRAIQTRFWDFDGYGLRLRLQLLYRRDRVEMLECARVIYTGARRIRGRPYGLCGAWLRPDPDARKRFMIAVSGHGLDLVDTLAHELTHASHKLRGATNEARAAFVGCATRWMLEYLQTQRQARLWPHKISVDRRN